ncbi:MAG TPA: DNA repair protein RadC [Dehalococcoidia bacterium]|nr:DNA repair protein RadC [Dehalococcoidia bacterium]
MQPTEQPSNPEYNTRIREIPASERPRERLRDLGAGALSNAELLAIVLRSGSARQSVLNLATSLLARHGGLGGLARLSFADLVREKGLGEAKAAEVLATFQLAVRLNALQPEERPYVRSPADVNNLLGAEMALLDQEHLRVLLINTRNQVMALTEVYKGNVSSSLVRTAEVFREAIRQNAPSIIVVHNHPSGDPSPSPDDVALTKTLVQAGQLLQIDLLDHIVIGDRRFASLKQLGMWP